MFKFLCPQRNLVRAGIVTACNDSVDIFKHRAHLVAIWSKLLDILLRQRIEAMLGMFLHWLGDTHERIEHLLTAVTAEVIPCTALICQLPVDALHCQSFVTAVFLEHTLLYYNLHH